MTKDERSEAYFRVRVGSGFRASKDTVGKTQQVLTRVISAVILISDIFKCIKLKYLKQQHWLAI